MMIPKPTPRRSEVRRAKAHRSRVIKQTYTLVIARDGYRCRLCGATRYPIEMHEVRSRAQLRGRPPEEIFNAANCLMVCGPATDRDTCHGALTARVIDIVFVQPERGCDGPVEAQYRTQTT